VFKKTKHYLCGEIFKYMGEPGDQVIGLRDADFDAIPTGRPFIPDGCVVRNSVGTVAYAQAGTLRWVPSEVLRWWEPPRPIILIPEDVFNALPGGAAFVPPPPLAPR
jgi:hypothetical protein